MAKRKKDKAFIVLVVTLALVTAAAVGTGAWLFFWRGGSEPSLELSGGAISYPQAWNEAPLSDADRTAGLLLRLERTSPEASILVRHVAVAVDKTYNIDTLAQETAAALGREIEGLTIVSQDVSNVASHEAVRIRYRQPSGDGGSDYETLMVIVPTSEETVYLTLRARAGDLEAVAGDGAQIMSDVVAYVAGRR